MTLIKTSIVKYFCRHPIDSCIIQRHHCSPVAYRHRFCIVFYCHYQCIGRYIIATIIDSVYHCISSNWKDYFSAIFSYQRSSRITDVNSQFIMTSVISIYRRQQYICFTISVSCGRIKIVWAMRNDRTFGVFDLDKLYAQNRELLIAPPLSGAPGSHDLMHTSDVSQILIFIIYIHVADEVYIRPYLITFQGRYPCNAWMRIPVCVKSRDSAALQIYYLIRKIYKIDVRSFYPDQLHTSIADVAIGICRDPRSSYFFYVFRIAIQFRRQLIQ